MFDYEQSMRYKDYTKYPDLFYGVYWGGFAGKPQDIIINNRNKFVEDYGIIKIYDEKNITKLIRTEMRLFDILSIKDDDGVLKNYKKSKYYNNKDFKNYYLYNESIGRVDDKIVEKIRTRHNEYYLSKKYDNCIIHIFSHHTTDEEDKVIIEDGYKKIEPLYSPRQKTFIKIAPKKLKDYYLINTIEHPNQETI